MAAYAEVVQGEIHHASLGVRGRPVIRPDYVTNGHVVLWAETFGRLVDPTVAQHPAVLAAAHQGQDKHGAPLGLARLTLDCIAEVGTMRNLGDLPHRYPRLGSLFASREQLPALPEQPPASWMRLNDMSRSSITGQT